jgi:predicted dehydrogenase
MIPEFHRSSVLECVAVCSRGEETGKAIAEQFGLEKVYTSLDAMLADPEIEMVYIGSPNAIHYSQTKAALPAGKHVLCEKPFAPTEEEAAELIALAKEKKLFLFEAITTAHHPHYAVVKEKLPLLGRIKLVMATFCQFSSRYPALLAGKVSPVLDPAYKGGALMDINLYNIHFTVGLFGAPENIRYRANLHSNGVDTSGVLTMEYPDFLCQCVGAKDSAANNGVQIVGEEGYMEVTPSASNLLQVKICLRGKEPEILELKENPWYYEVQDISRIIAEGNPEVCYADLETTRKVVAVLEAARKDAGLGF